MATLQDVLLKEGQMGPLHKRMDADKDLYLLKEYILRDANGHKVDDVIHVTLNRPALFAAHVISSLMAASQQIQVKGQDLKDEDTSPVEEFLKAVFRSADNLLLLRDEPMLIPFTDEQNCIRGRSAARVTVRMVNGQLVPEILPLDTRYFTYEVGVDGILWGAYRTWRNIADIKSEYPEAKATGTITRFFGGIANMFTGRIPAQDMLEVVDLWDRHTNQVYVGGSLVREATENKYGEPPFVVKRVPLGSMLKDRDNLGHEGESIFFLMRTIMPEFNRLASIFQTANINRVKGATQWHTKLGTQASLPESGGKMGTETAAEIGGGYSKVPQDDMGQTGRLMHSWLSEDLQSGSLSQADLGNANFPMPGVAIIALAEASGEVFLPRLETKGVLFRLISEMVIRQTLALGLPSVDLGTKGHEQRYEVAPLENSYNIDFLYTVKNPQLDVALLGVAESSERFFDRRTTLETVLRVPNPSEIEARRRSDDAELFSPGLRAYRDAKALFAQGKRIEATIMADEMGLTLEELLEGETAPKPGGDRPQPIRNTPVPGTKAFSNKQSSDLRGEPGPSVGEE
ncbi:hypothetical protein LCGC14_1393950 [marine sediment metagenome]|uniref:Uncharacterized protein n=1 Tax=marine sediment metagenome TaxID=412755 RepID=A0A0F9KJY3_9ZZZZ